MIPNVDIVDLLALQELTEAVGPTVDDFVYFGKTGTLLGNKIKISTLAALVSGSIGGVLTTPDRVYQIGLPLPDGASVVNDDDGLPTIIKDPYLDGLDYSVHLRGVEYLIKGEEWQNDVPGGGFRYTNGQIFEDGQIITVSFKPLISNILSTPDAIARFFDASGYVLIESSTTLTNASNRKLIFVQGSAAAAPSITLNAAYPEGVLCRIKTGSGNNKQTIILAPSGQTLQMSSTVTAAPRFILGQCDSVDFVRFGTQWVVFPSNDNWATVGHVIMGGIPGFNVIAANRQALLVSEYPRVEDYVIAIDDLLPGSVVPTSSVLTYPSKWAYDPGGSVIYAPDLRGLFPRFLDLGRDLDPSRTTGEKSQLGSLQQSGVGAHRHWTLQAAPIVESGNTFPPLAGPTTSVAARYYKSGSNGRESTYNPANSSEADVGLTSNPTPTTGAPETRPINVGLPPLIKI